MFVEIKNNKIEGRGVGCGKMKMKSNPQISLKSDQCDFSVCLGYKYDLPDC